MFEIELPGTDPSCRGAQEKIQPEDQETFEDILLIICVLLCDILYFIYKFEIRLLVQFNARFQIIFNLSMKIY